jgi:hypothetical protein
MELASWDWKIMAVKPQNLSCVTELNDLLEFATVTYVSGLCVVQAIRQSNRELLCRAYFS